MNKEKIHCSRCLGTTTHSVEFETNTESHDDLDDLGRAIASSGVVYTVLKCDGCEHIVFRRRFWHTDMEPGESWECHTSWHPPLVSRQLPPWHRSLPATEERLLGEIYRALHGEAFTLAMMGLRALLDVYMVGKVGDQGGFTSKLKKLAEHGYLSAAQLELVEPAIEAGSAAAHRGFHPEPDAVVAVLELVELLLHQDLLGSKLKGAVDAVPPRKKK
ncbi:hypothetical protein GCM10007160_42980 [Litchfieldella qijiaojingensis]|uniref:DUF4145 domain-containing protein n=1 Tax=Litchfieldella qijiaojingensis TaxID=980347 RepID=A0ABQ2ZEL5_9GAMM|nr:DUF4145 domain-containing protein [Halomonas qijiaojingensis]GGY11351.1 hypothetical protein GCM10007160_42980 [Halomonas qijiaojingensis]